MVRNPRHPRRLHLLRVAGGSRPLWRVADLPLFDPEICKDLMRCRPSIERRTDHFLREEQPPAGAPASSLRGQLVRRHPPERFHLLRLSAGTGGQSHETDPRPPEAPWLQTPKIHYFGLRASRRYGCICRQIHQEDARGRRQGSLQGAVERCEYKNGTQPPSERNDCQCRSRFPQPRYLHSLHRVRHHGIHEAHAEEVARSGWDVQVAAQSRQVRARARSLGPRAVKVHGPSRLPMAILHSGEA
mmetsp:Transcript_41815/g.72483  ORF Transcript_41815/g.72483 Transcript_41815/m.72483 type:complete len:244 (+) Transcript_41815:185-916(+)